MPVFPYAHVRSYTKEVLADTPLSFWPLNDYSASTVARDLAALHNGVYTGDSVVRNQAGPGRGLSGAVALGGTDDGILVGDFAEYDIAGDLTAECWFIQTAAADATLIGLRQAPSEWTLQVTSAGAINTALANTVSGNFLSASGGMAPFGVWCHAAMTVSGTTLTAYLNGVAVASSSAPTGTRRTSGTSALAIGFSGDTVNDEFIGRMAGAAVYTSALSAARLQQRVLAAMT